MRSMFGAVLALSVSCCLAACAGPSESGNHRGGPAGSTPMSGEPAEQPSTTGTTAAALSCPTVPAVKPLVAGTDAADVHIVAGQVWFRTSSGVSRVDKDGNNKTEVVSSILGVRSFVDENAIVLLEHPEEEDPDAPSSTIRAFDLAGVELFDTTQAWEAPSTQFVGSDETSFYVQTIDDDNGQDTVFRLDRKSGAATPIVAFGSTIDDVMTDAQIVGPDLWLVRGGKRVVKVRVTDTNDDGDKTPATATTPQEMFGSASQTCRLAVANDAVYCSDGKQIIRRDLTGANPVTIFDSTTDATPVALGAPIFVAGSLVTQPGADQESSPLGAVIRTMRPQPAKAEDPKVLACGRGAVTTVAADTMSVVWAEIGTSKGLYLAVR